MSTGPKATEGKLRAFRPYFKHGFYSIEVKEMRALTKRFKVISFTSP